MFVPVACLRCGKLFQVPPAAAGTDVTCPWCREPTPALPVAADTTAATPEPLSLDDAEPIAAAATPVAPAIPRRRVSLREIALVAVAVVVVAALTMAVLGYRSGRGGTAGWVAFTAPDGSCTGLFPTTPTMSPVAPNPQSVVTKGGEEYAAAGWYSGVRSWVAWQDLDPAWQKKLADDKDGTLGTLEAELARRVKDAGGTLVEGRKKTVQTTYGRGFEVEVTTPHGTRVERYVLAATGPRPRLYVVGVEAPKLDPDGALPSRVFTAFRIN
ncbi:MAG: hypothetical protein U0804_11955 [Gemmataceae bacterium]